MPNVIVYIVCKMTGKYCDEMRRDAIALTRYLRRKGITVIHPVLKERIPNIHKKLEHVADDVMRENWEGADKPYVKEAHVIIDTSPHLFSAGGKEEVGKGRYRDWKPSVALYPKGFELPYIVRRERDNIVYSYQQLAKIILKQWGTRWLRIKWRIPIYFKYWKDVSLNKLIEFWR